MSLIKRKISSLNYRIRELLFERLGIPEVMEERITKVIFKKYLPHNPVIIDCGAHDGDDSIALAKLFPRGTVHAFEPVEPLFKRLRIRTIGYSNIELYKKALAEKVGLMDFFVSEGGSDGSSSLLQPHTHLKDHPDTFFNKVVQVATLSLDSWAKSSKIQKVDLLWLDMQGYELNMLQASETILNTVRLIHTEVSVKETYKGVAQYGELKNFLKEKGFKVLLEAIPPGSDMGNVLFIKKFIN